MRFIPKHITNFINQLETELLITASSKSDFYLSELHYLTSSFERAKDSLLYADYLVEMIELTSELLSIAENAYLHAGIEKIPMFANEITIDEELIHLLNHFSFVDSEFKDDFASLTDFITKQPTALSSKENASAVELQTLCDYKEFKLVSDSRDWKNITSKGGIELHLFDSRSSCIRIFFVCESTGNSHFPKGFLKIAKQHLLEKYSYKNDIDFDNIREAFEMWFHIGNKGTYFIYFDKD